MAASSLRSLLLLLMLLSAAAPAPAQGIPRKTDEQICLEEYTQLHQGFEKSMEDLAAECDQQGLKTAAAVLRARAARIDRQTLDLDDLPEEIGASVPDPGDTLQQRQHELESQYAARVFGISQKAMKAGSINLAFHLVREVAFHDPDHLNARRMLGFVKSEGKWSTPFALAQERRGLVWHEEFGWLPEDHVTKYEQGLRFYRNRWMTKEQEEELRKDFDEGAWEIETEHFRVKTNHSLERGVELSRSLEGFHRYFVREFSTLFSSPQQMRQLFDGKAVDSGTVEKHDVHYYADRTEFVTRLRSEPYIEACNGIYLPRKRTAYFFFNPRSDEEHLETLFHEVTHQLLSESTKQTYAIAQERDFWVVEGLACYMESFRLKSDGQYTVGFPLHRRIVAAQRHARNPQEFVPIGRFVSFGQQAFQTAGGKPVVMQSDLQVYYAQATALSHFFLHYRDGIYRDAFIKYLGEIYSPDRRIREKVTPLNVRTGQSYSSLDQQFKEYLQSLE